MRKRFPALLFAVFCASAFAASAPPPTLTGTVVDAGTGGLVKNALIRTDTGLETVTGRDGRFALKVERGAWPKRITVRAAGFGDRLLVVPAANASTSLGDIYLGTGGTITIELRQNAVGEIRELELVRLANRGRTPAGVVRSVTVQTRELVEVLHLEDIDPGDYILIAKGERPWQRRGERVIVLAGETMPLTVQVMPFHARLRATRDGQVLDDARVILRNSEAFWETELALRGDGTTVELWQGGRFSATLLADGSLPWKTWATLDETHAEWLLEMARHEVVGTVIDAATREPVPHAAISLEMRPAKGGGLSVSERAGSDGTFRLAPVMPGLHTIKVGAKGYPVATTTYTFEEATESHEVTIVMEKVPMTTLRVTDAHGQPIADAWILPFRGTAAEPYTKTSADGTAPIYVPEQQQRDVFVIPRDGSLGAVTIASGAKETALRLPAASSRVVLRAQSEKGEPIPRIAIAIRHAGRLLPKAVEDELWRRGSRLTSDAEGRIVLDHMPAGEYEFWPVASMADRRAIAAGRPPAIRMNVVPGENSAVMTFQPSK